MNNERERKRARLKNKGKSNAKIHNSIILDYNNGNNNDNDRNTNITHHSITPQSRQQLEWHKHNHMPTNGGDVLLSSTCTVLLLHCSSVWTPV